MANQSPDSNLPMVSGEAADEGRAPLSAPEAAVGETAAPSAAEKFEWRAFRTPMRSFDRMLSRPAQVWLNAFPAALRPTQLCARYPRVANRLAICWSDPVLTEKLFEELLIDKRGNRQGFPAPVAQELRRLHAHHARHLFTHP